MNIQPNIVRRLPVVLCGLLLMTLAATTQVAAEEESGAGGTVVADTIVQLVALPVDLEGPVFITHAGDGSERLFIVERPGRVRIVAEGELLATPFLDISAKVSTRGECGLLSMAFAPDYAESGEFYVYYSHDVDDLGDLMPPALPEEPNGGCDTVIARFTLSGDPNVADAASEQTVLAVNQPYLNHNGGQLQFGPDGYLYVGLGDGGSGGDPHGLAQNGASLLGKMLRLDVTGQATYAIPTDNPFLASSTVRPEIWALGVRNPWRFSFDRENGDLWMGDVGQGDVEEINRQPGASRGGENYGWNILEGDRCFLSEDCDQAGLTAPIFTYDHEQPNCGGSVTGGYVYRENAQSPLYGHYIFGDFCLRQLWRLAPAAGQALADDGAVTWVGTKLLDTDFNVMSFGEDERGNLYVAGADNRVYRLAVTSRASFLPLVHR